MSIVSMLMTAVNTSKTCCQRCTDAEVGATTDEKVACPHRNAVVTTPAMRLQCATHKREVSRGALSRCLRLAPAAAMCKKAASPGAPSSLRPRADDGHLFTTAHLRIDHACC